MNQTLPEEFQLEAQNSLDELISFRAEIHADMTELQTKADQIKTKFADKLHQEGLKRGFLMNDLIDYEKCVNFNGDALNQLLQEDQDIWMVNL